MKKKQKEIYTGYIKVFNEEVRIDSTLATSKPKCQALVKAYKKNLKKVGVTVTPRVKIKALKVT